MTVSLMSLLGVTPTLSAANATGGEGQGVAAQPSNDDSAFAAMLDGKQLQDISATELRDFFVAHGAKVPQALQNTEGKTAADVLAQLLANKDGQKLPGDMIVALQEMLPQSVTDSVEQAVSDKLGLKKDNADGDVAADLPKRELTPQELSEIVQETGLSPIVIFAALQDTPMASPNLAHAMVEDMGAAEADANLPLPTKAKAGTPEAAKQEADSAREQQERLSNQLAAVDFDGVEDSKRDVLKRIVDVLRGEKAQGEFDWTAKANTAGAQNSEQRTDVHKEQVAKTHAVQGDDSQKAPSTTAPAATVAAAMDAAKTSAQVNAQAGNQKDNGAANADAKAQQTAQQPAPQQVAADGGTSQQTTFAATLEHTSSLRSIDGGAAKDAHLRHFTAQNGTPADQVQVHIRQAVGEGAKRMEIQLKPHELGRVDVRIDTDADGRSHVTVTADKKDTLDMLQRDARGLERALNDAGLKADSNSLSFNLRGDDQQQQQAKNGQQQNQQQKFDINGNYADDIEAKLDTSEMALTYSAGRAYRLNLDWGVDISA